MTHAYTPGNVVAIRKDNMKYVPGVQELFNIEFDIEEKRNLFNAENQASYLSYLDQFLKDWLQHIDLREEATRKAPKRITAILNLNDLTRCKTKFTFLNLISICKIILKK